MRPTAPRLDPWSVPLSWLSGLGLLVLLTSGSACKTEDPVPVVSGSPDLATAVSEDMSFSPPDFAMLCGYGQAMQAGACGCDGEHPQACGGGLFCCASGQRCLTGLTARCSGPPARQRLAMAFDPRRGVTLVRGGQCDDEVTGTALLCPDQWQLGPTTWQPQGTLAGPGGRSGASLGWDGVTGNLLLFGGQLRLGDAGAMSSDTWLWDGTAWVQKLPGQSPPARALGALGYDSVRHRLVLFGGVGNGEQALDDTWEWDGSGWTSRLFDNSPSAREGHGMVYDQKLGRMVLHGGLANGMYTADTWSYDGNSWSLLPAVPGMPARAYFAMAYDSDRGVIVVHGGESPGVEALTDTWEWDGHTWTRKFSLGVPPGRVGAAMIYDPARKLTLLFGGVNGITGLYADLWSWNGTVWKQLY